MFGALSVSIIIYGNRGYVLMIHKEMDNQVFQQLAARRLNIEFDYLYSHYDPHDTILLFYDVGANIFVDDRGDVHYDIHRILHPWQIYLFKQYKENCTFPDITNKFLVELVYPDYMYLRHT